MNWFKELSGLLTTLDNLINFSYFNAIDLIASHREERIEFQLGPFTGLDQYCDSGCQPLHYAIQSKSRQAIDWILSQSPPINGITRTEGWNPAHCAVIENDSETFWKLVQRGVDLNLVDWKAMTPLAYAKSDLEIENWAHLSNIDFEYLFGPLQRTYLHLFAKESTLKLLHFVIDSCPHTLNFPDKTGTTPLMLAAESGEVEATQMLLLKDAKYHLADEKGRLAIHRAAAVGQSDACKILLFHPDYIQKEEYLTENENQTIDSLNSLSLLLVSDIFGFTPLMTAVLNGHTDTVRALCEFPGHYDVTHPITGDTALHYAVQNNYVEMVKIILDVFADPDPKNKAGWRPKDLLGLNFMDVPVKHDIFLLLAGAV